MKELEYEEFEKYEVDPESIGFLKQSEFEKKYEKRIDHKFVFPNGYGASVEKGFRNLWI